MRPKAEETIAALATAPGESGIGIVRISGAAALSVADRIFVGRRASKPSSWPGFTVRYGTVTDAAGETIDEVLLSVMRAPRSYTCEDVVEVSCHGGTLALRRVLERVLEAGCRLAEPGEFTKRAFLNGRIDLAQAEAVQDIVRAQTERSLRAGLQQLQGRLSQEIVQVRAKLIEALGVFDASFEFPDEDTGVSVDQAAALLGQAAADLARLREGARFGRFLREGLCVVICGRPNVGKSSLLNALLRHERAIVTPIAGTTRDAIEERVQIRGIPVRLVDTAGIAAARSLIDRKAIGHSRRRIREADLVLLVFDGSVTLRAQDKRLMRQVPAGATIAVINKADRPQRLDAAPLRRRFPATVCLSAKKETGLKELEEAIAAFAAGDHPPSAGQVLVTSLRHARLLGSAQKFIAQAAKSVDNGLPAEFVSQHLREALRCLDELSGRTFSPEVLSHIFAHFCVGK